MGSGSRRRSRKEMHSLARVIEKEVAKSVMNWTGPDSSDPFVQPQWCIYRKKVLFMSRCIAWSRTNCVEG